jgi:glycerol kinase
VSAGVWADYEAVRRLPVKTREYRPRMAAGEREALTGGWRSAVRQAISRKVK